MEQRSRLGLEGARRCCRKAERPVMRGPRSPRMHSPLGPASSRSGGPSYCVPGCPGPAGLHAPSPATPGKAGLGCGALAGCRAQQDTSGCPHACLRWGGQRWVRSGGVCLCMPVLGKKTKAKIHKTKKKKREVSSRKSPLNTFFHQSNCLSSFTISSKHQTICNSVLDIYIVRWCRWWKFA